MIIKHIEDVVQGKATLGSTRSTRWPQVRRKHLQDHPICAVCEGNEKLEVHHIKPFHEHPELELDPTNLITLCESKSYGIVCHLAVGHLGNYKKINPQVVEDAAFWHNKLKH